MYGDVLCLSHLRWGFVYQRPNHLMSRCAKGHRVFFVEEPIFDAEEPRIDVNRNDEGIFVAVPHLPAGRPGEEVERMQRKLLDDLIVRSEITRPLLWFYTPMAIGWAGHLRGVACVYDCMDELSHFAGAPPILREREEQLFKMADLVFTGGQSLYEAKRQQHPRAYAFPSSVDFAHFEQARGRLGDPEDQREIPRPRLGFFGVVDERMDIELVRGVAERRPDLHLVMLGPVVKIDPAILPRLPNVHWLGQKSYAELPAYISHWDVAIMPFARNDATKFISPTKTLEYLAGGKPVVSTSIRDVVRPYGEEGLLRIADEPDAFIAAVDAALAERGTPAEAAHAAARDAMLAQTSWERTWSRMNALVTEVLARRERHPTKEEATPCSTI
jgi:UDP-galactopyranose mutase